MKIQTKIKVIKARLVKQYEAGTGDTYDQRISRRAFAEWASKQPDVDAILADLTAAEPQHEVEGR